MNSLCNKLQVYISILMDIRRLWCKRCVSVSFAFSSNYEETKINLLILYCMVNLFFVVVHHKMTV